MTIESSTQADLQDGAGVDLRNGDVGSDKKGEEETSETRDIRQATGTRRGVSNAPATPPTQAAKRHWNGVDQAADVKHPFEGALGRDIRLAGEAGLLNDFETWVGTPGHARDRTREGTRSLLECIYYRNHVLNDSDLDKRLNHLEDGTQAAKDARRIYVNASTSIQRKISTLHVLPEAQRMVQRYNDEGEDLVTATGQRLKEVIIDQWAIDPEQAAKRMWQPLCGTIDFAAMFHPPAGAPQERLDLMQQWRTYNFNVYLCAMHTAVKLRIKGEEDGAEVNGLRRAWAKEWREMIYAKDFSGIPPVSDVPIGAGKGYGKRRKGVVPAGPSSMGSVYHLERMTLRSTCHGNYRY
ncbi:hypothetical protein W97_01628 [Coniosporium apollinis CBS 100218]|uniref:Uncharacterized protein n=1 Tax=Coniosporium apollinis (strain CBS 100218) TaxID=1168221 RepID=R7YL83_CONA1|nr:uncharacterized protein W97_01628 [Coniosporium apollinis CBS 100218]EON62406.1 hypothetical protein W97_01628 [Coniosporium apollinis CBS 100218]